jgi:hypothetical protein
MILVRNTFQLQFGKAKEAKAVIQAGMKALTAPGLIEHRAYMDLSGPFYTLVLENTWESMGAFEKALADLGNQKEWQQWYAKLVPLVVSGHREIYSVIV